MAGKRKAATGGNGSGSSKAIRPTHYPAEAACSQRARLRAYLARKGSADTRQIRRRLNIMSPASRYSSCGIKTVSTSSPSSTRRRALRPMS